MAHPAISFAAPFIRAALATLAADMPAQVDQFNLEGNVQIEAPASYHFGGTDLLVANAWPQIEVSGVEGRLTGFSLGRVDADHDPTCNVAIWMQGDKGDFSELYEQSIGLARCAIECLVPPGAFGPGVQISQTGGVFWRADALPADPTADGRSFAKWQTPVFLQFQLETVELFA